MKKASKLKGSLTREERAIERDSQWRALDSKSEKSVAAMRAVNDVKNALKAQSITARINTYDLEMLKERAAREGLGYQTLLGSIVHKYVTDQLVDIQVARSLLKKLG